MKFYIIGIDDNKMQHFSDEVKEIVNTHQIFSGGLRHYDIVQEFLPADAQWIEIKVPLDLVFEQYKAYEEVVVFASGDPLFFGFANTIQRKMPEAELIVYPFFNSLQLLAHRLLLPYQDMHIVSLTGRPWHKFDEALILGYDKIGVLTDNKKHTPASIAERMLHYGYDNYSMSVGELLGNDENEKVGTFDLKDVETIEFSFPNNVILQKTVHRPRRFGIPDLDFNLLNGRTKMITKMPIRLLSLSLLELREKNTLWDIGFCTGSVSVEAKLQFPHLEIHSFEIREEGKALIHSNACKFGTPGIESYIGDLMMMDTSLLSSPDAVFIGGHGGMMRGMIAKVCKVMKSNGVIVFNSVSEESYQLFKEAVEENKLILEQVISVKIDDNNTIQVMKAIKTI